jgi:hypothetical protein
MNTTLSHKIASRAAAGLLTAATGLFIAACGGGTPEAEAPAESLPDAPTAAEPSSEPPADENAATVDEAGAAAEPSGDTAEAAAGSKECCKGMNECKGKGGCKTDKHGCKGKNDCKGKGGCNMHCPK